MILPPHAMGICPANPGTSQLLDDLGKAPGSTPLTYRIPGWLFLGLRIVGLALAALSIPNASAVSKENTRKAWNSGKHNTKNSKSLTLLTSLPIFYSGSLQAFPHSATSQRCDVVKTGCV